MSSNSRWFPPLLMVFDALSLLMLLLTVFWMRDLLHVFVVGPFVLPVSLFIIGVYLIDGYRKQTDFLSLAYTSLYITMIVAVALTSLLLTFAVLPHGYFLQGSRASVLIAYALAFPVTLGFRRTLLLTMTRTQAQPSILFLGELNRALQFQKDCEAHQLHEQIFYSNTDGTASGLPFHPPLDFIKTAPNLVAVVIQETQKPTSDALLAQLLKLPTQSIPTYTLERFHEKYWRKVPLYRINLSWAFQDGFMIAHSPIFERIKRLSDIVFALFGGVIALPFIVFGAVAIKLDDGGPIFFSQQRTGRDQVPFKLLKLRTMRVGAKGSKYTAIGDSRITRVGKFLRQTRLDELPQLWNVFTGDMSLIGPRAEWDQLVAQYEKDIPYYHLRHLVKPGITGWAQTNMPYGASVEDTILKFQYDLYYIRHYSFTIDASIILRTLHTMFLAKGR